MNTLNRFIVTSLLVLFTSQVFATQPIITSIERTGLTTLTITHDQPVKNTNTSGLGYYKLAVEEDILGLGRNRRMTYDTVMTAVNADANGFATTWNMTVKELVDMDTKKDIWKGRFFFWIYFPTLYWQNSSAENIDNSPSPFILSLCYLNCDLTITSPYNYSIHEGVSFTRTLVANDSSATFSIIENTSGLFSLNNKAITFDGTNTNFENGSLEYNLKVKASTGDGSGKNTEQIIRVAIKSHIAITANQSFNVLTNATAGTVVGTVATTKGIMANPWIAEGDASNLFTISNTGVIVLNATAPSASATYTLKIKVIGTVPLTAITPVTVNIISNINANNTGSTVTNTPDAFGFHSQQHTALNTFIVSQEVVISGLGSSVNISSIGGEYQVNQKEYTSYAGTVNNGDTIKVRHLSSNVANSNSVTELLIGTVSAAFNSTTREDCAANVTEIACQVGLHQIGRGYAKGLASDVEVVGNIAYMANGTAGLKIFNIDNLSKPVLIGSFDTLNAQDVEVINNIAYMADYSAGLKIVDVSDPSNPSLLGSFQAPSSQAHDISVVDNKVYMATGTAGLQIIDVSDSANPSLIGSFSAPHDSMRVVKIVNNVAYTVGNSGLKIIDISNPSNPSLISSLNDIVNARDIEVIGNIAYVVNASGLKIIDISNPGNPSLINSFDHVSFLTSIKVIGNIAYVTYEGNSFYFLGRLYIIDISNLNNPSLIVSFRTKGNPSDVEVIGNTAFVANGGYGLQTIDVSNLINQRGNAKAISRYYNNASALAIHVNAGIRVESDIAGISCTNDCNAIYPNATKLRLTVSNIADAEFSYWSGDCTGTDNPLVITLRANTVCFANTEFSLADPIVRASKVSDTYSYRFDVTLSSGKNSAIYYTVDGSEPDENDSRYTTAIHIEDSTTLKYFAKNMVNSKISKVQTQVYTLNLSGPQVLSGYPENGQIFGTSDNFIYTFQSLNNITSIQVFDQFGNDLTHLSTRDGNVLSMKIEDGVSKLYQLTIIAKDDQGNQTQLPVVFNVDTITPSTKASPKGGKFIHGHVTVDLIADENNATIYYSTDGQAPVIGAPNTMSGTSPIRMLNFNTNTYLQFFAVDAAGNQEAVNGEMYYTKNTRPDFNFDLFGLIATYDERIHRVILYWDDSNQDNSMIYKLYRVDNVIDRVALTMGISWDYNTPKKYLLADITNNTWYIDKNLSIGAQYSYAVSKVVNGIETKLSNVVTPNIRTWAPTNIKGAIDRAQVYLNRKQQKDGAWSNGVSRFKPLVTSQVLDALQGSNSNSYTKRKALYYLKGEYANNNELLARKINTLASYQINVDSLINRLVSTGDLTFSRSYNRIYPKDSGWGAYKGFGYSAYETALGIIALKKMQTIYRNYSSYLARFISSEHQNGKAKWQKNSYFNDRHEPYSVYVSALLNSVSGRNAIYNWLIQNTDGSYGNSIIDTAGVLLYLDIDSSARDKAVSYLISRQSADGSFTDVSTTAICLQALTRVQP